MGSTPTRGTPSPLAKKMTPAQLLTLGKELARRLGSANRHCVQNHVLFVAKSVFKCLLTYFYIEVN